MGMATRQIVQQLELVSGVSARRLRDRLKSGISGAYSSDGVMDDADCTSESWNLRTSFHSVPYRRRLAQAFQLLLIWLSRTLPFSDLDVACRCPDLVVEMLCSKLLCAGVQVNAGSVSDVR